MHRMLWNCCSAFLKARTLAIICSDITSAMLC
jgi:hypothetical protein